MKRATIKRQKCRRMSLRYKIILPMIFLVICLLCMITLYCRQSLYSKICSVGGETALSVAEVSSSQLSGFDYKSITDEGSDEYKKVQNALASIKDSCSIAYIYVLMCEDQKVFYLVDPEEGQNHSGLGDEYEVPYEECKDAFAGVKLYDDFISDVEGEKLISALVPIFDDTNNVVAVLGCDYDAQEIYNRITDMTAKVILIGIVMVIVSSVIILFVINFILKKLYIVNGKIYDLANTDGDLTQLLEIKSGDELELIADNVNSLVKFIREIVVKISENTVSLDDNSDRMVTNVRKVNDNISNISATMEEMSASMQETSSSLHLIMNSIQSTDEEVNQVAEIAQQGENEASTAILDAEAAYSDAKKSCDEAVATAKNMADTISEHIEKSKQVEKINELTENILNISSQTNLLALNASIEAARAGEAGRGFAVVADEISKLAADSGATAEEIQNVSASVVAVVEDLAGEAGKMLQYLNNMTVAGYDKLLDTSEEYRKAVESSGKKMKQFVDACGKLTVGMSGIRNNVDSINNAVEESAQGVTLVAENTSDLFDEFVKVRENSEDVNAIVKSLQTEVNKFKV